MEDIAGESPRHEPVMLRETLQALDPQLGQVVCDGTLGAGGHGRELLKALGDAGVFIGLDRDPQMLEVARKRLKKAAPATGGPRVILVARPYEDLPQVVREAGLEGVDRVLLDLGFNSLQVDDPSRGFSFSQDGPLDGRYSTEDESAPTMADLVNTAEERQLADWLYTYGDERLARPIARRIVERRREHPLTRTSELAQICEEVYPPRHRRRSQLNPATRTFQALRIAVNDELGGVERGVQACMEALNPGGRLCVLSYHSGEDRIVKRLFDEAGTARPDPNNPYSATTWEGVEYRVERRGAEKPGEAEIEANPRARSARMRVLRRLSPGEGARHGR